MSGYDDSDMMVLDPEIVGMDSGPETNGHAHILISRKRTRCVEVNVPNTMRIKRRPSVRHPKYFYGFLDNIEKHLDAAGTPVLLNLMFDCVSALWVHDTIVNGGFAQLIDQRDIAQIAETRIANLSVTPQQFIDMETRCGWLLAEGGWYVLEISNDPEKGLPSRFFLPSHGSTDPTTCLNSGVTRIDYIWDIQHRWAFSMWLYLLSHDQCGFTRAPLPGNLFPSYPGFKPG